MKARGQSLAMVVALTASVLVAVLAPVTSGATTGQSSSATSKDWAVTVWVAQTIVKAGTPIAARVTVVNRTNHTLHGWGCRGINYEMALTNTKTGNALTVPTVLCSWFATPGPHVAHTRVRTTWMECGAMGTPTCTGSPEMPALPPGVYHTDIIMPGAKGLPTPAPITVRLTA